MVDIVKLGERIKHYRKKEGMTQNELAIALGVSFQAVSNWERGIAPPDIDNLVLLSRRFNVLLDTLINQDSSDCMLGIDGGGTKTEFVVFTTDGTVKKRIVMDASNPNDIGLKESIMLLKKGIDLCLIEFPEIKNVFCGVAGAGAGINKQEMIKALSKSYKNLEINIDTDVANLIALDKNSSVYLICGTGSVVMANNGKEIKRFGGWGYLFDEQGSAYDIGKDGIKASLAYADGFGEYTLISELIEQKLNGKLWTNIKTVYENGKPYIASLAPLVFDAYEKNDKVAIGIIDNNCKRLALLLNSSFNYSLNRRVTLAGGLATKYSDIIVKHISNYCKANFIIPSLPPVYGACVKCLKLSNYSESNGFEDNFKKTYNTIVNS
ncbi:MAG: XRE family transcriptional regulator [Clostridiales bacterium]|nr:XRE family transcriptional regulator [Clostridiales bacterium]